MSDTSSGFAYVSLKEIFDNLVYNDGRESVKPLGLVKKILLVEDDPMNMAYLNQILTDDGYEVEKASDGLQALVAIGKNDYDLILSDIKMPNFNGYQLLEFIKEKDIEIPVVFLSAYISETDEIKGLQLGAAEHIRKPVQRDLLRLRLKNIFQ